jgi:hypothetical protein
MCCGPRRLSCVSGSHTLCDHLSVSMAECHSPATVRDQFTTDFFYLVRGLQCSQCGLRVTLSLYAKLSTFTEDIWPPGLSHEAGLGSSNSSAMPNIRASWLPCASLSLDVTS